MPVGVACDSTGTGGLLGSMVSRYLTSWTSSMRAPLSEGTGKGQAAEAAMARLASMSDSGDTRWAGSNGFVLPLIEL